MGKRKIYQVCNGVELSFPASVNGKRVLITFQGEDTSFSTINEEIQKRIESRPDFGSVIKLVNEKYENTGNSPTSENVLNDGKGIKEKIIENNPINEPEDRNKSYIENDTSDWQIAKEFLRSEPYNIPYQALTSPERILSKAEEVKVHFPNLIIL